MQLERSQMLSNLAQIEVAKCGLDLAATWALSMAALLESRRESHKA